MQKITFLLLLLTFSCTSLLAQDKVSFDKSRKVMIIERTITTTDTISGTVFSPIITDTLQFLSQGVKELTVIPTPVHQNELVTLSFWIADGDEFSLLIKDGKGYAFEEQLLG